MKRTIISLSAVATAFVMAPDASAILKVREPFKTTAFVELGGQGTGGGWDVNLWSTTEETEGTNYFQTLGGAASITSYGSLLLEGRSVQRSGRGGKAEANRLWKSDFSSSLTGSGNETWFSLVLGYFDVGDGTGGNPAFAFTSAAFDPAQTTAFLTDTVATEVGFGLRVAGSTNEIFLNKWKDASRSDESATSLPLAGGETTLLVGRFNWEGTGLQDTLTLWKVPEAGGVLDELPSITTSAEVNNTLLDRVAIFDNERSIFDEIRIAPVEEGETSQDGLDNVTPGLSVLLTSATLDGDLDGDGFVGLTDLDIILGDWNLSVPPGNPLADVSGPGGVPDGFIGLDDLDVVLGNWNAGTPPTAAVPEPATLALMGLGAIAVLRRRG